MNTFDEALKRLDKHIWYMCHRFEVSIYGQDVEDLRQEALIKLYEIYSSSRYAGKTTRELDVIFKKSLWNLLRDLYATGKTDFQMFTELDVDVEGIAGTYGYDGFMDVYLAYYREDMAKTLSQRALNLLELLLNPTPAVYHMFNIHCMRVRALQSQGHNVRVPKKITHELVGSVLGYSIAVTKNLIRELQEVWSNQLQPMTTRFRLNAATS